MPYVKIQHLGRCVTLPSTYVKSFSVGVVAMVIYLVLIPAIWLAIPIFVGQLQAWMASLSRPGPLRGYSYAGSSHFSLKSPWFLAFAMVVFIASFFWEFRKLSRSM